MLTLQPRSAFAWGQPDVVFAHISVIPSPPPFFSQAWLPFFWIWTNDHSFYVHVIKTLAFATIMLFFTFAAALTLYFHGAVAGPQSALSPLLFSYSNTDIVSISFKFWHCICATSSNASTTSKLFQQLFLLWPSSQRPSLVSDSYYCDLYSRDRNSRCE